MKKIIILAVLFLLPISAPILINPQPIQASNYGMSYNGPNQGYDEGYSAGYNLGITGDPHHRFNYYIHNKRASYIRGFTDGYRDGYSEYNDSRTYYR